MIADINPQPAPKPTSARKHRRLLAAAGVSAMAVMAVSLSGVASAATPTKTNCTFKTANGHYVTAVNSGGLTGLGQPSFDVMHTDAVRVGTWETFALVDAGDGTHYGIRAFDGHYLTAVGGGGRTTDVIHSDATQLQAWEKFTVTKLPSAPGGQTVYSIGTIDGHFLTAVGGGGRTTDTIHSDATVANGWEQFHIHCGS
ncbi:fascin domain-containing protein [Mycobacterium sp. PDNC021]|uniref:fascin domain-containing protein n=1 Tax=Mycobacterium sp. PDNC021 TaxID=3391399 RepID=UPI003AAA899D